MVNDAELLMLLIGMVIVSIALFIRIHDIRLHNDANSDNYSILVIMGIGIVIGAIGILFIAYKKFIA